MMNRKTWSWNAAGALFAYGFSTLAALDYMVVGADQLIGGPWPDNEAGVSMLDWHTGTPNAKYWIVNLLATTVGGKDLKTLTKATVSAPTQATDAAAMLHAMPYILDATKEKGVLLINKKARPLAVQLQGLSANCSATIVEVSGAEPACNPPVQRSVQSGGTLELGPLAVAIIPDTPGCFAT